MTKDFDYRPRACLRIIVLGLLFLHTVSGQSPERDLYKNIGVDHWSADERSALEKGEIVVKPLETGVKYELASLGVLRIKNLPAMSMDKFRESLSQRGSEEKKTGGRFSDPPSMDDLRTLKLEKDAIDQLKKCTVSKCDLNLSADMITRFQREIDWTSPNAETDATRLISEMLVAYVRDYIAHGNESLGTYNNRRNPVDLAASHRSLLTSSTLVSWLAPEFIEYLEKFPGGTLENVDSSMQWSVVDFGLKPSITISHTAAYTQTRGEAEQLFIASKQIYSSRYLDSSLTFTLLLRVATENGADAYLIFVDRSRSDALDGPLGRFARGIVQKKSLARIETLLDKAHLRLLTVETSKISFDEPEDNSWTAVIRPRPIVTTIAVIAVVVGLYFVWQWRRASPTGS